MTSLPDLTREAMQAAFAEHGLLTISDRDLDAVPDADARQALRVLGMPRVAAPWFSTDTGIGGGFRRVGEVLDWDLADRYDDVPPRADRWICLSWAAHDGIALDPETGRVLCLPQDAEIYLLNSGLRSFIHFLYALETERPNYDMEWEGDEELDPDGARRRVEAAMRSVDPAALEQTGSLWFGVLEFIVDPESDYY
jgi:SUKH-4 immunity protein